MQLSMAKADSIGPGNETRSSQILKDSGLVQISVLDQKKTGNQPHNDSMTQFLNEG